MTSLDSTLKSRDIALPTKVCLVKAMVFPVVMYGCESWTIKKAWHWRIDAFELWCWRRFLDWKEIQPVHPKGNQSWIFIGRTDAEAETPIFWPPDVKNRLIEKDPDPGKDWRQEEKGMSENEMVGDVRGWDGWMASPTWTCVWVNSGSWWWTGNPGMLQSMGSQGRTRLSNWTELKQPSVCRLSEWPFPCLVRGIFPTQGSTPKLRIAGRFFTSWATREAQEYWSG